MSGMLYAGYGWCWRSLYLGAESFVHFGSAKLHSSDINFRISSLQSIRATYELESSIKCCQFGLDVLPGFAVNSTTLLYARVGVGAARTHLQAEATNIGTFGPFFWNNSLGLSKSKHIATLRLGGGVEQRLSPRITLRTDYIYTDYGKLTIRGSRTVATNIPTIPAGIGTSTNVHLYDHALLLGLSYRFTCLEAFSVDPCITDCAFQGVYIGGALGGGLLAANQEGNTLGFSAVYNNQTQGTDISSQVYNNQFQGLFFLGYGKAWYKAYLGGELIIAAASHNQLRAKGQSLFDEQ